MGAILFRGAGADCQPGGPTGCQTTSIQPSTAPGLSGIAIMGDAWYSGKTVNRALIIIGIVIVLAGLFWKQLAGLPFFKLPGDIIVDRPGFKFFFPITTMIVVSLVVSLLLWLFRR
jgi:hypothetical protein